MAIFQNFRVKIMQNEWFYEFRNKSLQFLK